MLAGPRKTRTCVLILIDDTSAALRAECTLASAQASCEHFRCADPPALARTVNAPFMHLYPPPLSVHGCALLSCAQHPDCAVPRILGHDRAVARGVLVARSRAARRGRALADLGVAQTAPVQTGRRRLEFDELICLPPFTLLAILAPTWVRRAQRLLTYRW